MEKAETKTTEIEKIEDVLVREGDHPDLQQLLLDIIFHTENVDAELISRVYHFAEMAHRDQERKSGVPFIHHSVEVARILASLHLDSTTIAAGLLHDVVEDTKVTPEEVRAEFGEEMSAIVDGVTEITELKFKSREVRQAERFRRMLLSMVKDIRVILVKFADRLHNMRTLEFLEPEQREWIALETRDIYAPLAHRLGIARIRWELEDLSLKYLDPETYKDIQRKIALKREEREEYIEEIKVPLQSELAKSGIDAEIVGRPKNFYSIYNKMKRRNRPFEEIYDLLAIRIIVNTVRECYHALGLVHSMYTPVTDRFKDFIAMPKSNMYQSLHTTVIGPRGEMAEIQIRTKEMHQTAEEGIAAHWRYKEGQRKEDETDRHMAWLRHIVDWQRDTTDPSEFMEELKIDLFQDEIFVFTPRGDVIQLPKGASPLDFAFSVHTDIGLHCMGALVNGQMVSLSSPLKSCDTVEIITSPHRKPSQDWLDIVKTSRARSRIKRWLKEEKYAHSVQLGQEMMERELKRTRTKLKEEELLDVALSCGAKDIERLYAAIGSGEISINRVMGKIFPEEKKAERRSHLSNLVSRARSMPKGVRIQGMDNMMILFGKCCNPVPGDGIVGLITRGRGVSVHRTDCPNIVGILKDRERIVMVDWDVGRGQDFTAQILVQAKDRKGLLSDIAAAIARMGINVKSGDLHTGDGMAYNKFTIEVRNLQQLKGLIKRVGKIKGVTKVGRLDGSDADS